jgi:hypothetical protein
MARRAGRKNQKALLNEQTFFLGMLARVELMSFTLEDIQRLRSNWCDTVTVGELPPELAMAMDCMYPSSVSQKEVWTTSI